MPPKRSTEEYILTATKKAVARVPTKETPRKHAVGQEPF